MIVKLMTEHPLKFLSLKGGCRGSSESTLVKMLEISCSGSLIFVNKMHYLLLIHGMLIQLAEATAAKGTILPTTGGNFCNKHVHPENIGLDKKKFLA